MELETEPNREISERIERIVAFNKRIRENHRIVREIRMRVDESYFNYKTKYRD